MSETCTLYEDGTCSGTPVSWCLFLVENDFLVGPKAIGTSSGWQTIALAQNTEYALLSQVDYRNAVQKSVQYNNYSPSGVQIRFVEEAEGTLYRGVYTGFPFTLAYQTAEQLTTPTNLTSSNITINSAQVSWTGVENASSYKVEYRQNGQSTWTDADI
jgi:hypothetical protein